MALTYIGSTPAGPSIVEALMPSLHAARAVNGRGVRRIDVADVQRSGE